jgi:WD40 repeat protein
MKKIEFGFPQTVTVIIAIAIGCSSPKAPVAEVRAPVHEAAAGPPPPAAVATVSPEAQPATTAAPTAAAAQTAEQTVPLVLPPAKLVHVLQHPGTISSLSFAPTSAAFVSGCSDRRIRLWSAEKGRLSRAFVDHSDAVSSVAFRFDGAERPAVA